MIFTDKEIVTVKSKSKSFTYSLFSTCKPEKSGVLGNIESENAVVKDGLLCVNATQKEFLSNGKKLYLMPFYEFNDCCIFREETGSVGDLGTLQLGPNNSLAVSSTVKGMMPLGITFGSRVNLCGLINSDGKNLIAVCSKSEGVYIFDTQTRDLTKVLENGGSACAVFHDRLFIASADGKIYFSAPCEYYDWTYTAEGVGEIDLTDKYGEACGFAVVGEKVYLFFEFAVFKLTVAGSANDFIVDRLDYDGTRIYKNSVCVVGEYAVFMTKNGLKVIKDGEIKDICKGKIFKPVSHGENMRAIGFEDKAFYSFVDENNKKIKFTVIPKENRVYSLGSDINILCVFDGKVMSANSYSVYEVVFEGDGVGKIKKNGIRLTTGRSLLKSISFKGEGNIKCTVSDRYEKHIYPLNLDEKHTVRPLLRDGKFDLEIEFYGGKVNEITFFIEELI